MEYFGAIRSPLRVKAANTSNEPTISVDEVHHGALLTPAMLIDRNFFCVMSAQVWSKKLRYDAKLRELASDRCQYWMTQLVLRALIMAIDETNVQLTK